MTDVKLLLNAHYKSSTFRIRSFIRSAEPVNGVGVIVEEEEKEKKKNTKREIST